MNPHSHLNPVPGDTYYWTPSAPHSPNSACPTISLSAIPPTTTWKKLLCQPSIHTDQAGRLLRRVRSIINTDPLSPPCARPATLSPTSLMLMELTQPLPAAYTIYVDGGWETTNADFTTAFQEQRDPTNHQGSAGIAIVPTGPDWMNRAPS